MAIESDPEAISRLATVGDLVNVTSTITIAVSSLGSALLSMRAGNDAEVLAHMAVVLDAMQKSREQLMALANAAEVPDAD